jgi:hypothetical protein
MDRVLEQSSRERAELREGRTGVDRINEKLDA